MPVRRHTRRVSAAAEPPRHTPSSSAPHRPRTALELAPEQMLGVLKRGLPRTTRPQKIAVVGAGMSGLVAAGLLHRAGHAVTLIEAASTVGGRVKTLRSEFSGGEWSYCDVGAMRIPSTHTLAL